MSNWLIDHIPSDATIETRRILKLLPKAHAALAELKGVAASIPDQSILIKTLALREAQDSSAIENIITSQDDLYRAELNLTPLSNLAAKEVQNYNRALLLGFELIREQGIITNRTILRTQENIENNRAGYRRLPGTALKNAQTGATIYTPPQEYDRIVSLMNDLERYINTNEINGFDPLVKMAIIHYQFESIHPFYDGNGRTGRIINVLYLIQQGLLDLPILYLSSYIIQNKSTYYSLFQTVWTSNDWEEWIVYFLEGVAQTAISTVATVRAIRQSMRTVKQEWRSRYKFYSQDLLNTLYQHPYTKIDFVTRDLRVTRPTASSYLNQLTRDGWLRKERHGNNFFFVNIALTDILSRS